MKIKELMDLYDSLKIVGDKELPFDTALIVAKNLDIIRVPAEVADKKRREIIDKYLYRDEDGKPIKAFEGAYKLTDSVACNKELEELMGKDIEIDTICPIPRETLSGLTIAPVKLSPILKYIE